MLDISIANGIAGVNSYEWGMHGDRNVISIYMANRYTDQARLGKIQQLPDSALLQTSPSKTTNPTQKYLNSTIF